MPTGPKTESSSGVASIFKQGRRRLDRRRRCRRRHRHQHHHHSDAVLELVAMFVVLSMRKT